MCWNESVSLNTFLLGAFAVTLGLLNNAITVPSAIFYLSFISMQGIEYFLWKHLHNRSANAFWSKIGLFLIFLQPIAALSCIGIHKPLTWGLIAAYLAFIAFVVIVVKPLNTIDFSSSKANNGHLQWNWLRFPLYAIIIWSCFLLMHEVHQRAWFFLISNVVLISVIYFLYIETNTWGSLWCWIANVMSIVILWKVFSKDICTYLKKK